MQLESLRKLFITDLQDIYSAENQALQAYPQLLEKVSNPQLKQAFQMHMEETRQQVQRVEQIFEQLGEQPGDEKCEAMEGLIKETQELLQAQGEPDVLDAALIASAQKMEHYEIASYGTVITYADMMDETEVSDLLQTTLDEEYATDDKLTALAESVVNIKAQRAGGA